MKLEKYWTGWWFYVSGQIPRTILVAQLISIPYLGNTSYATHNRPQTCLWLVGLGCSVLRQISGQRSGHMLCDRAAQVLTLAETETKFLVEQLPWAGAVCCVLWAPGSAVTLGHFILEFLRWACSFHPPMSSALKGD